MREADVTRDQLQLLYALRGLLSDAVIERVAAELGWPPTRVRETLNSAAWAWESLEVEDEPEEGQ